MSVAARAQTKEASAAAVRAVSTTDFRRHSGVGPRLQIGQQRRVAQHRRAQTGGSTLLGPTPLDQAGIEAASGAGVAPSGGAIDRAMSTLHGTGWLEMALSEVHRSRATLLRLLSRLFAPVGNGCWQAEAKS